MTMLPFLPKNSLEYFPVNTSLRGTAPSSSMIKAMWSTITHRVCRAGRGVVRWRGGQNNGQLDQTVLIQSFTHPERRETRGKARRRSHVLTAQIAVTHWRTSRLKIVRRIGLVCFWASAASGRASSEVMPHFCGFEATTVRLLCWGPTSKKSLLENYWTCAEEDV